MNSVTWESSEESDGLVCSSNRPDANFAICNTISEYGFNNVNPAPNSNNVWLDLALANFDHNITCIRVPDNEIIEKNSIDHYAMEISFGVTMDTEDEPESVSKNYLKANIEEIKMGLVEVDLSGPVIDSPEDEEIMEALNL